MLTANTEGARFDRLGLERSIARAVLALPGATVEDHDLPTDLGQSLSGTYSIPGRGVAPRPMTFTVNAGKLVLKDGARSTPLSFLGGRRFVVPPSPQTSFAFAKLRGPSPAALFQVRNDGRPRMALRIRVPPASLCRIFACGSAVPSMEEAPHALIDVTLRINGSSAASGGRALDDPARPPARAPRPHRAPRRAATTASAAPARCWSTAGGSTPA